MTNWIWAVEVFCYYMWELYCRELWN